MSAPGRYARTSDRASASEVNVKVMKLTQDLFDVSKRASAELELAALAKDFAPHIAVLLWHAGGPVTLLLKDLLRVYPDIAMEKLSDTDSDRTAAILNLFAALAGEADVAPLLLRARIVDHIIPILHVDTDARAVGLLQQNALLVLNNAAQVCVSSMTQIIVQLGKDHMLYAYNVTSHANPSTGVPCITAHAAPHPCTGC